MENLDNEGLAEHGPEIIAEYLPETVVILEHLGIDRLAGLQEAVTSHISDGIRPKSRNAAELVDFMVHKHARLDDPKPDLAELGRPTIADAIADISLTKNAVLILVRGKMTIQRAIDMHRRRVEKAVSEQNIALLRKLGTVGTYTIHEDVPTGLSLVQLLTPEHCVYEGVSLRHSLAIPGEAEEVLARGAELYSLRKDGTDPRATLEVNPLKAAVIQARRVKNRPLHVISPEYEALCRALGPLAGHLAVASITITDKILLGRNVDH